MQRSNSSRREFLSVAASSASGLLIAPLRAAEPDSRLAGVLARTISVDLHSHVGIPFGKPNAALPQFDLPGEMKRTGFSAVVQTWEVDSVPPSATGQEYIHFHEALDFEDRLLAATKVKRALTLRDLEAAHARRQPVIIQAAEGAQFLEGHIERVDEAHKRGLRVLQPVHERDDRVKPMADIYTRAAHLGGLTEFGAEVVKASNRLGVVVDLTHMSYDAVKSALKISAHPMIFSHTSLVPGPGDKPGDPRMAPRLLSKEEVRDITAPGGVIGVWWHGTNTVKEYVEQIKRVADAAGVENVGIGTDTDLEPDVRRLYTNAIWKGETRGMFPAVAQEMLASGFTPDEVTKVGGGNFCRLFGKVAGAR